MRCRKTTQISSGCIIIFFQMNVVYFFFISLQNGDLQILIPFGWKLSPFLQNETPTYLKFPLLLPLGGREREPSLPSFVPSIAHFAFFPSSLCLTNLRGFNFRDMTEVHRQAEGGKEAAQSSVKLEKGRCQSPEGGRSLEHSSGQPQCFKGCYH